MKTFIWISAVVICSISCISVSEAQSQTVKVQSGQSVTLWSPTRPGDAVIIWSRLINANKASCICSMTASNEAHFCDGFNKRKYEMGVSTNNTVFLTIKTVELSDSGLYFCQYLKKKKITYYVIQLNAEGSEKTQDDLTTQSQPTYETTCVMSLILSGLTVFLLMIVTGLVVSLRKLQTAENEEQKTRQRENLASDDLNYAAVSFCPKKRRREVESNAVYSATR
ncbi:uncharacterized protein LOC114851335 [Betta splendens]|uniref:Uncharacterized protein LOC114851335 n=1 Tax=Betta splendens TaxID=158456 RepID=A0A6P7LYA5_BETSP|nr:uncharacterized protein LOC114851335 [Betta splendens]